MSSYVAGIFDTECILAGIDLFVSSILSFHHAIDAPKETLSKKSGNAQCIYSGKK